jgi:hypothetical protein
MIQCYGSEFDIPDLLIEKFLKDFDGLAGSGCREDIQNLRDCIEEVVDLVGEEPELLHEKDVATDFVKALAMKQALAKHGILYDA